MYYIYDSSDDVVNMGWAQKTENLVSTLIRADFGDYPD